MAELDGALDAARRAGAIGLEKDLEVMALGALALEGDEDGTAPIAFTRTLTRLHNAGDWQTTWAVLESVARMSISHPLVCLRVDHSTRRTR